MMREKMTRRGALAGLLASAGSVALANGTPGAQRPRPRPGGPGAPVVRRADPSQGYIDDANLGGAVGFALLDLESGEVVAERAGEGALPPASTLKAVTALYALDRLGPGHRFRTELLATGPLVGSEIQGDLVLISDGDPTLDTDRLLDLARGLSLLGVTGVTGRFLVWGGALPQAPEIAAGQPVVAGYNPGFGGLNLNFNRVHFKWERNGQGYDTQLLARGVNAAPETRVAEVTLVDRPSPIFDHMPGPDVDRWTVARAALGKDGARWLPVRHPALYAGDVFRALAADLGIKMPPVDTAEALPNGTLISGVEGPEMLTVLRGMLKFSTNLTAEVSGLASTLARGLPVNSLRASAARMAGWAMARHELTARPVFEDHSGLGYGSAMAPVDMARILSEGYKTDLPGLLKPVNLALSNARPTPPGVRVVAKTGTLNFVSTLAGYLETGAGRSFAFAIFTGDVPRRDAVPQDQRSQPSGGRSYARRSRTLQRRLLRYWGTELA